MNVAYDCAKWLIILGWDFMGLLFTPAGNKYIVMGEKRGFARGIAIGEARAIARFADWLACKEQAEKDGRAFTEPPPFLSATPNPNRHPQTHLANKPTTHPQVLTKRDN